MYFWMEMLRSRKNISNRRDRIPYRHQILLQALPSFPLWQVQHRHQRVHHLQQLQLQQEQLRHQLQSKKINSKFNKRYFFRETNIWSILKLILIFFMTNHTYISNQVFDIGTFKTFGEESWPKWFNINLGSF